MPKLYPYIGPAEIAARLAGRPPQGARVADIADLLGWLASIGQRPEAGRVVVTFVIDADGWLLVADRHSEHAACAGLLPVRSAGELSFLVLGKSVEVEEVSNQSTGYCPETSSWTAVRQALQRAGLAVQAAGGPGLPEGFTLACEFRRCPGCSATNLVKDGVFECALCRTELPEEWNFQAESGGL